MANYLNYTSSSEIDEAEILKSEFNIVEKGRKSGKKPSFSAKISDLATKIPREILYSDDLVVHHTLDIQRR